MTSERVRWIRQLAAATHAAIDGLRADGDRAHADLLHDLEYLQARLAAELEGASPADDAAPR